MFTPGISGNPSGKPKANHEWVEFLRTFMSTKGGWQKLIAIANGEEDPKDQLKALMFIAEQAYGKAPMQIAGADENDFSKLRIIIVDEASKEPDGSDTSTD